MDIEPCMRLYVDLPCFFEMDSPQNLINRIVLISNDLIQQRYDILII